MTDITRHRFEITNFGSHRISRQGFQVDSLIRRRLRAPHSRPARIFAIAVFAVALLATMVGLDRFYRNVTRHENQTVLREALQRAYHEIETGLLLRMTVADDLSAHLRLSLPLSGPAEFAHYAAEVLLRTPQIRALEFADANDIIRYVFPIAGNESALNLDLKHRPGEYYVAQTRRLRTATISAPVRTAQGSLSIVIRSPVVDGVRYLGTAQAVSDISSLLGPLSLALGPRFGVALEDVHGVPIWGDSSFSGATLRRKVKLGGTPWTLVVGWVAREPKPSRLILFVIWVIGLAFIGNLVLWFTRTRTRIADLSESVEQTSADLAATQQRYRTLVETADDMIVQLDLDGTVMYANSAYRERKRGGIDSEASSESSTKRIDDDEGNIAGAFAQVVAQGKHSVRYSVAVASGETANRYARLNLIRDENGRPDSILAIIRDVSELRRLEEETALLQEEFHQVQKLEAIGLLAASVAHDFNNILTVINGNAELIRLQHSNDEQTLDNVDTILQAGLRAAELAGQLLSHGRRQTMPPEAISLNDRLAQSGSFLGRLLGENIEVRLELEPNLWNIYAASTRIEQVVMNLSVNARDAMPGGGTLTFETANAVLDEPLEDRFGHLPPGEYVRLTVKDTGSGMSPEVQSHLFEPFFSTKGRERGTGLGLATVHGIIKQCGGHVSVASELGRGSDFVILFPRADSRPGKRTTRPAAAADGPVNGTVLIAEDEEEIRVLAATVLRKRGYRVLEASDGEGALQLASEYGETIDLLLTDLMMPRLNGKRLADLMRTLNPTLKIVFVSGHDAGQESLADGSTDCSVLLQKPFSLSSLLTAVGEALAPPG